MAYNPAISPIRSTNPPEGRITTRDKMCRGERELCRACGFATYFKFKFPKHKRCPEYTSKREGGLEIGPHLDKAPVDIIWLERLCLYPRCPSHVAVNNQNEYGQQYSSSSQVGTQTVTGGRVNNHDQYGQHYSSSSQVRTQTMTGGRVESTIRISMASSILLPLT